MLSVFSRRTIRTAPRLTKCLVASILFTALVLLWTEAKTGEYLDRFSDHFHHSRATWSFFVLGPAVYTQPFGVTAAQVPYPQAWVTWENHPVAYPPGMFVVFALPALLGRFVPLSTLEFGKIVVAYLSLIMHAALWAIAIVSRRVGSAAWMAVIAFLWIFSIRMSLLGFYDGAWLLTAALAVHAMQERRHARAVLWFLASALLSYRAVCLAPIAAVAYWQMLRGGDSIRTKAVVTLGATVGGALVVVCFAALLRHGPKGDDGAHGLPVNAYYLSLVCLGVVIALVVARGASPLLGTCVALSSVLSHLHGAYAWHGYVLVGPIFALALARRRPLWVQILLGLWFVYFLQAMFWYPPLLFADELVRFFANHGYPPQ